MIDGEPTEPSTFLSLDEERERIKALNTPPEKLRDMLRLILPQPEVLPLMAEAFGEDSRVYQHLEEAITGGMPDPEAFDDIMRVRQWYEFYLDLFEDASPIR
jgi:hypothetical protein